MLGAASPSLENTKRKGRGFRPSPVPSSLATTEHTAHISCEGNTPLILCPVGKDEGQFLRLASDYQHLVLLRERAVWVDEPHDEGVRI